MVMEKTEVLLERWRLPLICFSSTYVTQHTYKDEIDANIICQICISPRQTKE